MNTIVRRPRTVNPSILIAMKEEARIAVAFGKALKAARARKKVSQEKLAFECSLDRTFISMLERGLRQPSITTIFKLSKALNVPPTSLVRATEAKLKPSD